MKTLSKIFFFAIIGAVLASFAGVPMFSGMIGLQVLSFIPMPAGVLSINGFSENMTPEQKEFAEKIQNMVQKRVHEFKSGLITEEVMNIKLKELHAQIPDVKAFSELSDKLKEMQEKFGKMVIEFEKAKQATPVSKANEFDVELQKAVAEARTMSEKREQGFVTVKANTDTILESSKLTGDVIPKQYEPGVNRIVRRSFVIRAFSSVGRVASNVVSWVYQNAVEGTAANTAEGNTKAQISMDWIEATTAVKKITAWTKVSEELLNDWQAVRAEIDSELIYQIEKQEETQLLTGNGQTVNLEGVTLHAPGLTLASLQNSITDANNMDALAAAATQIISTTENNYQPNVIFLNPVDDFKMKFGSKDANGEYLIPNFATSDGTQLMGVRLVTTNAIPAGYFLIGDMSRFQIRDREGLRVEIGRDGNDFIKNLVTIRAEKRLASFVKNNDYNAFVYTTFAAAKAWILNPS